MKKKFNLFSSLFSVAVLVGALSWGISLNAQDATQSQPQQPQSQPSQAPDSSGQATPSESTPTQTPSQAAPAPSAPAQTAPTPSQPTPEAQAQSPAGTQTFTGTIMKAGDKYVLQDAASGTTYDIDHQDEVAKFEGKKVRVHGTVDASGKMIHVQ
jgi:cytoskeletal protein RodZ